LLRAHALFFTFRGSKRLVRIFCVEYSVENTNGFGEGIIVSRREEEVISAR